MTASTPSVETSISGGASAFVDLLNSALLEECLEQVNREFSLPLMSRLPSEFLPTRQRNLTDVRTRVGTLLEYSFALALQKALKVGGADSYRISYVVANQYPDLVIRNASSEPVLRIEMKALELISEEKSANFDALVRDVHPEQDILCVLIWEWSEADLNGVRVDFPEVKRGFAFEAYPIAKARDLGWLAQYSGGRVKGIDVAGPVVGDATSLKKEEHNMGKLMRILGDDEVGVLPEELAKHRAIESFREFKSFTISAGLAHNASRFLRALGTVDEVHDSFVHSVTSIQTMARGTAANSGKEIIVAAAGRITNPRLRAYEGELRLMGSTAALVLIFNEKFSWSVYDYDGYSFTKVANGRKFEGAQRAISSLLVA